MKDDVDGKGPCFSSGNGKTDKEPNGSCTVKSMENFADYTSFDDGNEFVSSTVFRCSSTSNNGNCQS
ncbi:hypothetical protein HPP92_003387 [Vanilla planifolia]|uniref:Uncharacterized protein n=1 Tax=Vanilla planifolia TaxID=51239 RepID=A0A835S2X0_VANPL|nr:hypothetical protein HPP92_003387 [Vanilla planifolia]